MAYGQLIKIGVGNKTWNVAVARTDKERSEGLSKVSKLKPNTGMLFIFNSLASPILTTMEMSFTIDVICFNDRGIVNDILYSVSPKKIIAFTVPVKYFLEVADGEAKNIVINKDFLNFGIK